MNSLMSQMENALDIGRFISYNKEWDFIQCLEDIKKRIDYLAESGQARETIRLYEMFLSGCYEKADEIDDSSGSLGMFFEALFCSWINARQKAECPPEETIYQTLKWMDNDDYGFCYDIEKSVVKVLNRDGLLLFEASIQSRFDEAFLSAKPKTPGRIYDYPFAVRHNADILKVAYIEKEDIASYVKLCEKIGTTPRDCENIAILHKDKSHFQDALVWVDKGLELEAKDNWPNESSYALNNMKRELLDKLGRREDAFESAWAEFKKYPSEYNYDELMKYIPKKDFRHWHKKAIEVAMDASLSAIIEICVKTKEWNTLAECIIPAKHEELEDISHYKTEKAAEGLLKKYPLAAAKVYRALGMRILKSRKSKYYEIALEHLRKVKELYKEANYEKEWLSLVESIRKEHSRKSSFIGDFEKLVSGKYPETPESFGEITKKRWQKQMSGKG